MSERCDFAPLLKKSNYGQGWDVPLKFEVFVLKGELKDSFHHAIVIKDSKGEFGCVTLELGKEDGVVVARSRVYQKKSEDHLEKMGMIDKIKVKVGGKKMRMKPTMNILAQIAGNILRKMGNYDTLDNNCQDFCNHFLGHIGLSDKQYPTTPEIIANYAVAGTSAATTSSGARSCIVM